MTIECLVHAQSFFYRIAVFSHRVVEFDYGIIKIFCVFSVHVTHIH